MESTRQKVNELIFSRIFDPRRELASKKRQGLPAGEMNAGAGMGWNELMDRFAAAPARLK